MKRYCSTADRTYYTHMREILLALDGETLAHKWLISDYEACPWVNEKLEHLLEENSFLLLPAKELLDMLAEEDFQWIWAVFSAIPNSFSDEEILKYPLPTIRDNEAPFNSPIIQHPLAELEIVAWDSTGVWIVSKQEGLAEKFRVLFPKSK